MDRTKLIQEIKSKLNKRQHVLLTGDAGMGKSWLLDAIQTELDRPCIRLSMSMARKALALEIARHMFNDGHNIDVQADDWPTARKILNSRTVEDITEQLQPYFTNYTWILDDLERATEKTCRDVVEPLLAGAVLTAADISTKAKKARIAPVINRLHKITVPPLTQSEAKEMLWGLLERSNYPHWQMLETKMWNVSRGKPGVITDMLDQLGSSVSLEEIRHLDHAADGVQYVGLMVPTLLIVMVLVISSRYLIRGFDDPSTYMLVAMAYAFFRVFSPVLYKINA